MNPKKNIGDNESLGTYIYYFQEHDAMEVLLAYAILKERNYHFYDSLNKKLKKFSLNNNYSDIDEYLNAFIVKNGYDSILEFVEKSEFEDPNKKANELKIKWENARVGVILFCVIHFIYEIVIKMIYHGPGFRIWIPVIFNYLISAWFIKFRFSTMKPLKSSIFKELSIYGFFISFIVFLFSIIISFILSLMILNSHS